LEDFESLVEALSLGDGPEDDTEEEGEDADDDKGGGGSTGKGKGKGSSEDDAWADVPDRVDLATCKALLAKYYPGEEVTPFARENGVSGRSHPILAALLLASPCEDPCPWLCLVVDPHDAHTRAVCLERDRESYRGP
jgi:hypothetical protein